MEEALWRSFNDATMHLKTGVEFCREKAGSPLGVFKAGSINPKWSLGDCAGLVFVSSRLTLSLANVAQNNVATEWEQRYFSVRRLPLRA